MASYQTLRWFLIPAIAIHNFEEWLTFRAYRDFPDALPPSFLSSLGDPSWPMMQLALFIVTVAPAVLIAWASSGPQRPAKHFVVCTLAAIFLANVFVPHIPAAIINHGYAPGIASALLLNLPVCFLVLRVAVTDGVLSIRQMAAAGIVGLISLLPAIMLAYSLSYLALSAVE